MTATPLTIELLREAARAHPLLLILIANPPEYEYVMELPNGGGYTNQETAT